MMLGRRFPMLRPLARWALLALGTLGFSGCGPGTASPDSPAAAATTARGMVRPLLGRSGALSTPAPGDASSPEVTAGSTSVVLAHRAPDGTLRVGCVDSEDGAEALVRGPDDTR